MRWSIHATLAVCTLALIATIVACTIWLEDELDGNASYVGGEVTEVKDAVEALRYQR